MDVQKTCKAVRQSYGFIAEKDKTKECWVKTARRQVSTPTGTIGSPVCDERAGFKLMGRRCYQDCPEGNNYGLLCIGTCPKDTYKCGMACMEKSYDCKSMAAKVSKDAVCLAFYIHTGNVLDIVKQAFDTVAEVSLPICDNMGQRKDWNNGIDPDIY